jgi:hypothetical protein
MTSKHASVEESVIRDTLAGLLVDFREHAEVVLEAQKVIEANDAGTDSFDTSVARCGRSAHRARSHSSGNSERVGSIG